MYPLDDTIVAIASAPGGAARGIVRISGPQAVECVNRLFGNSPHPSPLPEGEGTKCFSPLPLGEGLQKSSPLPMGEGPGVRAVPPQVLVGMLRLPELHSPLPCDVYTWRNGRSYTGQPVVELHTIGSPPLLQIVLRSVCAAGARLAGPGEFTLRAFLAGRIDLTQAEAVLGVIDAHDSRELQVALGQLAGGLARPLHRLRDELLDLLAHVEASLDFADEDLSLITGEELDRRLAKSENDVVVLCRQIASRGVPCDAVRAVLVGRPNTGKSSLFNALAGDRAALVSDHAGTTRDYLTAELDLDGVKCRLIDTAGQRGERRGERGEEGDACHQSHEIERVAETIAAQQRGEAHVEVLCLDSTRLLDVWERNELAGMADGQRIVVLTKCDMPRQFDDSLSGGQTFLSVPECPRTSDRQECLSSCCEEYSLPTSSLTGLGIETLRQELRRRVIGTSQHHGDVVAGTAARCADSLRLAGECLQHARRIATAGQDELAAAEIHTALLELGKVVGAVYTDDLLDRIFSRFCIGK